MTVRLRKERAATFRVTVSGDGPDSIQVSSTRPNSSRGRRLGRAKHRSFKLVTPDASIPFEAHISMLGDAFVRYALALIGIRECWYFDLRFTNDRGEITTVNPRRKLSKQGFQDAVEDVIVRLQVSYFPETIEELVQPSTRHQFFLHVKQQILQEQIHCSSETAIVLASYAVQAKFGDFDSQVHAAGFLHQEQLIPRRNLHLHPLTPRAWEEKVVTCFRENVGYTRDEAEKEYLQLAATLPMFGQRYFPVMGQRGERLWLGIDACGVNIFPYKDKESPLRSVAWDDTQQLQFKRRKFVVKLRDAKEEDVLVFAETVGACKEILNACRGNHSLALFRSGPRPADVQQMVDEEIARQRREAGARDRARRTAKEREQLLAERTRLASELAHSAKTGDGGINEAQSIAILLAQRLQIAESELGTVLKTEANAVKDVNRLRLALEHSEEQRRQLVRRLHDLQQLVGRDVADIRARGMDDTASDRGDYESGESGRLSSDTYTSLEGLRRALDEEDSYFAQADAELLKRLSSVKLADTDKTRAEETTSIAFVESL